MNKIQLLLIGLFFFSTFSFTNAVIFKQFNDDFSGYNNQYLLLRDMNVVSDWNVAYDANTPILTTNTFVRDGAFDINCDVSKNASNACGVQRTLPVDIDLRDWNTSNSKIHIPIKVDDNSFITSVEVYLGYEFANAIVYRNNDPANAGFYQGWLMVDFDMNSPASVSGVASLSDVNFILARVVYDANQTDFNLSMGGLWISKPPNEFNNNWLTNQVAYIGDFVPQGYAMPFNYTGQGYGMSLRNNDKQSFGFHGRVFIPTLEQYDISKYDIDFSMDINQVDVNNNTRMTVDAVNFAPGDNFSACFISDINATGRAIGVEEWINGSRTFTQSIITLNYNDYNTMRCTVVDKEISVRLNGILYANQNLTSRRDGKIGIEVFKGRQNIKNVSVTLSEIHTPIADELLSKPEWTITRDVFLPLILMAFMVLIIIGGFLVGDIQMALLGIIMIFIIYTFLTALFFT